MFMLTIWPYAMSLGMPLGAFGRIPKIAATITEKPLLDQAVFMSCVGEALLVTKMEEGVKRQLKEKAAEVEENLVKRIPELGVMDLCYAINSCELQMHTDSAEKFKAVLKEFWNGKCYSTKNFINSTNYMNLPDYHRVDRLHGLPDIIFPILHGLCERDKMSRMASLIPQALAGEPLWLQCYGILAMHEGGFEEDAAALFDQLRHDHTPCGEAMRNILSKTIEGGSYDPMVSAMRTLNVA